MSFSDLLYIVIVILLLVIGILGYFFFVYGYLGMFICKFMNVMVFGLIVSFVLILVVIVYDCFFVIVFLLRKLKI